MDSHTWQFSLADDDERQASLTVMHALTCDKTFLGQLSLRTSTIKRRRLSGFIKAERQILKFTEIKQHDMQSS